MPKSDTVAVIHWFRKGLRLHDNPALVAAIEKLKTYGKAEAHLRPVFLLDPKLVQSYAVGPNRWRFLLDALNDLDQSLRKLGSRLYVLRGDPQSQFEFMLKEWNVKCVSFEDDTEPYAKERDVQIRQLIEKNGVELKSCFSHTIFEPYMLLRKNNMEAPKTYQKFIEVASRAGKPPDPVPTIVKIYESTPPKDPFPTLYQVPTLKELKVDESQLGPQLFPGGETPALARLEELMKRKTYISTFEKPKTSPNSLEPSTTVLSPYLKFGCLSARLFYTRLLEIKPQKSQPPVSLLGQLYWREFFYLVGCQTPNFTKMRGNPLCKQINWDTNPEYLEAWKMGRTGYPFIDAIMTQLRTEGWIHHLARHAVACFLTRGDLYISWEEGMKVFEEYLLDADVYMNAGNWLWLSASAFFHQYYRVYSPIVFGKKTDPHGNYIRKYVPKLAKYPPNYIYEPWTAPLATQKAAGCIIGTDYPKPIVDHAVIHKKNIERHNAAYRNKDTQQDKKVPQPAKRAGSTSKTALVSKKSKK